MVKKSFFYRDGISVHHHHCHLNALFWISALPPRGGHYSPPGFLNQMSKPIQWWVLAADSVLSLLGFWPETCLTSEKIQSLCNVNMTEYEKNLMCLKEVRSQACRIWDTQNLCCVLSLVLSVEHMSCFLIIYSIREMTVNYIPRNLPILVTIACLCESW